MNNAAIGVYDSGVGGLSVWGCLRRALPAESLVYLGDGKNCPYGERSASDIRRFADEAMECLVAAGCKMVVVACNTATAAAIDFLREKYAPMPIVGLEPAVKPACLTTRSGIVGVVATERSLEGGLFNRTAARYGANLRILTAVGRGWVELVERNAEATPEAERAVREVLEPMMDAGADKIVLGCTHYPFLRSVMETLAIGRNVEIIDSGEAVVRRTRQLLAQYGLEASADNAARYDFLTFADEAYRQRLADKAARIANDIKND